MQNVIRSSVRCSIGSAARRRNLSSERENGSGAESADVPSSDPSGNNNSARRRIVSADDEVFKRTTRKKSSNIMETSVRSDPGGQGGSTTSSRLYKILVVGDVHTGKSAVIRRYVHDFFSHDYRSTVGVDFHVKIIPFGDDVQIRLQLWDIAGQDRFSQMTRAYYRGAHGALLVFDLTSRASFESVRRWKRDVDQKCHLPDGRRLPVVLLANKCDLNRRDRGVPDDVGLSEFAQGEGFAPKWFKTSALTGQGIEEAMRLLLRYILAMDTWNSADALLSSDSSSLAYDDALVLSGGRVDVGAGQGGGDEPGSGGATSKSECRC